MNIISNLSLFLIVVLCFFICILVYQIIRVILEFLKFLFFIILILFCCCIIVFLIIWITLFILICIFLCLIAYTLYNLFNKPNPFELKLEIEISFHFYL